MTTTQILHWIKQNLSPLIQQKITGTIFPEEVLAGMAMQETGDLINKILTANPNTPLSTVAGLMRGDYTQRVDETEKSYHGYGIWQIDIKAYPDFVRSGNWKDANKNLSLTVQILGNNKKYLDDHFQHLSENELYLGYIIAGFNCGMGNASNAAKYSKSPDAYTANHCYVKNVEQYASIYKTIIL